jgi:hypothetical protein
MFISPSLELIEGKNNKIGMLGVEDKSPNEPNSFLERVMQTADRKNDILQWLEISNLGPSIFLCNNPDGTAFYLTPEGKISKQ